MKDMPQAEAEALLANPLICADAPDWRYNKLQPGLVTMECGLVQQDGTRSGLQIQLIFARSQTTGHPTFKFTVFRVSYSALQRVYQFHLNAVARAPKNWHDEVHEHMGDARILGHVDWLKWGFSEALDYFTKRANIVITPPLTDPEAFELKP